MSELVKDELDSIKLDLYNYFSKEGVLIRIIYRTCHEKFGREGPDNLIPNRIEASRVSIYLDFRDRNISSDNLRMIVAIPEADADKLPKFMSRFGMYKVDIDKLHQRYIFKDLDDLKINCKRIFL